MPFTRFRKLRISASVIAVVTTAALLVRAQSTTDRPDATRFTRSVLLDGLSEPMEIEFDDAGRVYWSERVNRTIRRLDERTGTLDSLGTIPAETEAETGVIGFVLAPDFSKSKHLYVNYAGPVTPREMRLSRFTLGANDQIDLASEKIMLRWFWEPATHMGGGMTWDAQGNLYLATGDDTGAGQYSSGLGPTGADSSRTASNTNDYRGKILRIHPEPAGSYTIPQGNLFPSGTPQTKPEIFSMGNRNPWRLSVDSATGYLHWGEVGPDGGVDSPNGDPRGYDEFNIAHRAANFGWPYQIGYNLGYRNYDHKTGQFGPPMEPARPINSSPRNTGLLELPAAVPAALAYPYAISEEFPQLNGGGRMAVGGPVYRAAKHRAAARPWPAFFEGRWIIGDFVRNWIMVATLNQDRTKVTSLERLVPDERFNSIMDLDFGPNGDLYVLEYGHQGVAANSGARLSKIVFNAGNRAPRVVASADRTSGALPFQVQLSSKGTIDHDADPLRYEWIVTPAAGTGDQRFTQRFTTSDPRVTLNRPGTFQVALTVTDAAGLTGSASLSLVAGNEPPQVRLELTQGNRTFFMPGQPVSYRAVVSDREDKVIPDDRVFVTAEYVPSGLTPANLIATPDALRPGVSFRHLSAMARIAASDCRACHQPDVRTIGPSFREISLRYKDDPSARPLLAAKVIAGGSGVWGPVAMAAHPDLTQIGSLSMIDYILSTADASRAPERLPSRGLYRGGSEGVLQSQQAAMVALNASVSQLQAAAAAARTALLTASLTLPADPSNMEKQAAALAAAEQALAVARADALTRLQASETRLTAEQVQTLVQQAAGTAAPAGRGGGAGTPRGAFVLRASYEDRGANGVAPIVAGDIVLLRPQVLRPEEAEVRSPGITFTPSRDPGFFIVDHGAYIGYRGLDLTGVDRIEVSAVTAFYNWPVMQGADVEARLGSPTGRLLGTFSIYPGGGGGRGGTQAPPPVSAPVPAGISGIHDVYFVFVNSKAKPGNQLMLVHNVAFRS